MNRNLYLFLLFLACLALPLAAAAQPSAPTDPSAPDAADFLPDEPNDTFATATALTDTWGGNLLYTPHTGYFLTATDVDYFAFQTGAAGVGLALEVGSPTANEPVLRLEAALYDAAHNLLAEDASCASDYFILEDAAAPAGDYFLRLRPCAGTHNADDTYSVHGDYYGTLVFPYDLAEGEPNNTRAQATPIAYGQTVAGEYETDGDNCASDWFRFQGRAGDVLRYLDYNNWDEQVGLGSLYDANGNYLNETVVLPADGTYYLRLLSLEPSEGECYEGDYRFRLGDESLWVSAAVDGLGGNAAIKRGDIAARQMAANDWAIVFDASDVGLTQNVVAFDRMPNGSLLLSLGAAQNVPGLGKVMPQDIIRFVPTSLGANTAGRFEWVLDGSDVGLTTTGEKIDAINWRVDVNEPLTISLSGNGSVPRQSGGNLSVADEDTINFVDVGFGANSAGKWRVGFDGSTRPGLAAEDITALERIDLQPARLSFTLMVLDSAFNLGGLTGGPKDVLGLEAGAPFRMANKAIDGLAVGPAW